MARGGSSLSRAVRRTTKGRAATRGFSLIELMIALIVVSILMAIGLPSYKNYVIRASREQAQTLLLQLAGQEEKIFLNSSAYAVHSTAVTKAYDGTSAGGLGLTSGKTPDGKYTITIAPASAGSTTTFTITATPVTGLSNEKDGNITLDDTGQRKWGTKSW